MLAPSFSGDRSLSEAIGHRVGLGYLNAVTADYNDRGEYRAYPKPLRAKKPPSFIFTHHPFSPLIFPVLSLDLGVLFEFATLLQLCLFFISSSFAYLFPTRLPLVWTRSSPGSFRHCILPFARLIRQSAVPFYRPNSTSSPILCWPPS